MTRNEVLKLIQLLETIRAAADRHLALPAPDPILSMTLYLLRRHVEGNLVTVSSLAAASGIPYTTAFRRIEEMERKGMIIRRARTETGFSSSIHPSRQLVEEGYGFLIEVRRAIAEALNMPSEQPWSRAASRRVIPGPSVLEEGLGVGQSLRILAYDDPTFFVMKPLKRTLSHLLGGNLTFEGCVLDELRALALKNVERQYSSYDIITVDLPWVGEFAAKGVIRPLDELMTNSRLDEVDFYPADWAAAVYKGRHYGIPIQANCELLFVRRDLLEAARLLPPGTTDEVLAAARALHVPLDDRFGILWAAAKSTPVGHSFIQTLAAFGRPVLALAPTDNGFDVTHIDGEQMRPTIDTPEGRMAADYLRQLCEYSPPRILDMSWEQSIDLFARGHAAMIYAWSVRAGRFELDPRSPARGKVGFLPHPIGLNPDRTIRGPVSPIGGFVLSIPANLAPERADLAWRAIEWLSSPEVMKLFVQHGSLLSSRFSVSADPEVRQRSPVIDAVDAMARQGQLRLWPRPPVPEFAELVTIIGTEIHTMLRGKQTVNDALRKAQDRANALMRERGYY